jgi:hypothetical protein
MRPPAIVSTLGLAALLAGVTACDSGNTAPPPPTRDAGLAAFATINTVLQHPRCRNCHPSGDAPLQGDEGRVHDMNVQRGPDGEGKVGQKCTTCHGPANLPASYGEHTPPGEAKPWRMPPADMKMVIVGVAPGPLCEQLKDPARNGHKDMKALREHWDDPLVKWGWDPGAGRAPVPVPHEKLVAAFETWSAAGAPCP